MLITGTPPINTLTTISNLLNSIHFLKAVSRFFSGEKTVARQLTLFGGRLRAPLSLGSVDNRKFKNVSWRFRLYFHIKLHYGP